MQAVILAGGLGTRLRAVTGDLPKPLAPVAGKPLLDWQLQLLRDGGATSAVLLTGYAGDQIQEFCGDGSRWGLSITCVREDKALGTAGAVLAALDHFAERFLVLSADTVFDFDVRRMAAFHSSHNAAATLFLHPNDHPFDSDIVEIDTHGQVIGFHPYPHPEGEDLPNLVNAGVYMLERDPLRQFVGSAELPAKPDFGKHLFALMLRSGLTLAGYNSPEYVKDAGTPDRLEKTGRDILSGRVSAANLRHASPAVFLDRDGTLIEEDGYVTAPGQVRLIPGVSSALYRLNRSHYRTVMVTNQPVLARGDIDEAGLQAIHYRLETLLGKEHAYVDRIYVCPHHPDKGFPGERAELKIACECRKPQPGMLLQAQSDLHIDLSSSWMIGDTTTDVLAAHKAGVRSVLVGTGLAGRDGKYPVLPDFEVPSLEQAVTLILDRWPVLAPLAEREATSIPAGSTVLVAGLARAGKSTFSSILAHQLRAAGKPAAVLPLDSWLRGEDEDRGKTVLDRYNVAGLLAFVERARAHPGTHRIARYDRLTRRSIPDAFALDLPAGVVIILEGVPALAFEELRSLATRSFFITRPEHDRIAEMTHNYRWRGWDDDRIAALLAERAVDELPLIEATRQYAEFIVGE